MSRLSACVITYNEEGNIVRCLRSLSFADEIIVVDSGSTDQTADLAGQFASRVIKREWPGFGPQKEFAFSQATGDWILSIDADEEVTPELREEILAVLNEPGEYSGFRFPRKNYIGSYWVKHGSCFHNYPDYVTRLFRNGRGGCGGALVHEGLGVIGQVKNLKCPLLHRTYQDWPAYRASMNYFGRLNALEMLKKHRPGLIWSPLYPPYVILTFVNYYLCKTGFLMGIIGLRTAYEQARYVAIKYGLAIIWQLTRRKAEEIAGRIIYCNRV